MKEDIFNKYVDRVVSMFGITKEEFFCKTRKSHIVDSRHLVYYLCSNRSIKLINIIHFMGKNGYTIANNSIRHGINSVEKKLIEDRDYKVVVSDIEKAVFI